MTTATTACEACDLGWPVEKRDGVWWHESPTGNVGCICRTRSPEAVHARSAAKSDVRLDAQELRATADELAADYQVPPDVLQPLRDYADSLDRSDDA